MTALSKEILTPMRGGESTGLPSLVEHQVAASTKIYAGSIVVRDAIGYFAPATGALGLYAEGRAERTADNSAGSTSSGVLCLVRRGTFRYGNSGSITVADVGGLCYMLDDNNVSRTDVGGTLSPAGVIEDVDSSGVWVTLGKASLLNKAGSGGPTG